MCLLVLLGAFLPRFTLALLWLFGRTDGVYDPWWLGLLGFFFVPFTTLAFALIHMHSGAVELSPGPLVILAVALLLDTGAWGGTRKVRREPKHA